MTQNTRLLAYLREHDGITTLEAMTHLKICRLSERIRELEAKGYYFSHTPEHTENARAIRYRLLKAAPQKSPDVCESIQTSKLTDECPSRISASAVAAPYKSWMHG